MFLEEFHNDVILITNKFMAATLLVANHRPIKAYEDSSENKFFCIFTPTHEIQDDIKRFYDESLVVSAKLLGEELLDLDEYLGSYECYVHDKLNNFYGKSK